MQKLFSPKLGIAALFATATLGISAGAHAAEAVVYTSNNVQVIDVALDIAKDVAPKLNVQRVTSGTGALMKRIEAEAQNPLGDVVWGAGFGTMAAFKHNFQPYQSPQAKGVDPRFYGPDNLWVGTNAHVMLIMVNEKQLKGEAAPKSWQDLFDKKWKGKIIIGDPATSGSAYDQIYGIYKLYGQEGLNKLAANAVISKSSGQVYKSVADGEYPIGVTMEYAAYSYVAGGQKEIKLVYPTDGVFVAPEAVAIIKNPKNGAESAQQLYDVLLSREVQEAELIETYRRPTRTDINVAEHTELPNLSDVKVFETDPLRAADEYKEIIEGWKKAVEAAA
jgi:ABC-type Fe3+ transport system, periplasmic component